jgi:hypothetical protein
VRIKAWRAFFRRRGSKSQTWHSIGQNMAQHKVKHWKIFDEHRITPLTDCKGPTEQFKTLEKHSITLDNTLDGLQKSY